MIDVVTPDLIGAYHAEIEAMHRLRYRVFAERLGWEVEAKEGLERDEYDDLGPTYLLARDCAGEVRGTWRLLPTTGPYMLRDVFPEMLEGRPAPNHPRIWETSRFAVDGGVGGACGLDAVNRLTRELFCGLVELCIAQGIAEILTVYDIRIARLLGRIGCEPRWRSGRHRVGGTIAVAGGFDTNDRVLKEIRSAAGIAHSVLHQPLHPVERHAA